MSSRLEGLIAKAMWTVLILFALRCWISWHELTSAFSAYTIFGFAGEAISFATMLVVAYNRWLWKYDRITKTPVLKKKYRGILKSSYNNQSYEAEMEVNQTYLSVSVIVKTNESKSKSLTASIDDINGEQLLTYCYLNTPNASVRDRSAMHYGTAMLCVDNPSELIGNYYTDRSTLGEMKFTPVV